MSDIAELVELMGERAKKDWPLVRGADMRRILDELRRLQERDSMLRETLDKVDDRVRTADWNLQQCGNDCNDWCRARDRLQEAQALIEAVLAADSTGERVAGGE